MHRIEVGASAIGEEEMAEGVARLADAVRKGERQQTRYRHLLTRHVLTRLWRRMTCARHPSPAGRQLSHVAGAARAVAAEAVQPIGEIDIVAAKSALDHHRG